MIKNQSAVALGQMGAGKAKNYSKRELALRTRRLLKAAARSRLALKAAVAKKIKQEKHTARRLASVSRGRTLTV